MYHNLPITTNEQTWFSYFNMQPSQVKGQVNSSVEYYKRILYNKIYSVFDFTIPKEWHINWFRFWLFQFGSIAVIYTKKFGWICAPWSPVKLEYQYQPKIIMVTNSYLDNTVIGEVGNNASIIHLFDDYYGYEPIVCRYAELLANVEKSLNVNLFNTNVSFFAEAENKKKAEEIYEAYSEASTGKPFVVVGTKVLKGEPLKPLLPNSKQNFLSTELLEVRRGIMNAFLTEVGIRNVSVQKKERLTQGEYEENNDETQALTSVVFDNLKKDIETTNRVSGLNLSVKLRYDYTSSEQTDEKNKEVKKDGKSS